MDDLTMDDEELGLIDILSLLKKNLALFIVLTLLVGGAAFGASYLLPNEYTASTTMYVLLRNDEKQASEALSQTDLNSAQMVANDVVTILKSDRVKKDVADQMGLEESLRGFKTNVTNAATTRVITLDVTSKDPEAAALVANAMVKCASDVAVEVMNIQSVNVIDEAQAPTLPSGPKHLLIGGVGAAAGFFLAFAIAFVRDSRDTRVRTGEEASRIVGVPVVGHFSVVE